MQCRPLFKRIMEKTKSHQKWVAENTTRVVMNLNHNTDKDVLEHAYLLESTLEYSISYKERSLALNRLKLAKRDTKGRKI